MDRARRRAARGCKILRLGRAVALECCCYRGRCASPGALSVCGLPRRSMGLVASRINVSRTGPFLVFGRLLISCRCSLANLELRVDRSPSPISSKEASYHLAVLLRVSPLEM
eukprot:5145860-Pyramimonas_sp.AAC.1